MKMSILLPTVMFALYSSAVGLRAQTPPPQCGPEPFHACAAAMKCTSDGWVVTAAEPNGTPCSTTYGGLINGTCVGGGHGIIATAACSGLPPTHTLSVTVSGPVSGTLVLKNGSSSLSISADGRFPFPARLGYYASYDVQVKTQPGGGFCTLGSNSSGTVNGANVNVEVKCLSTSTWTPVGPAPVANPGPPPQGGNAGRVNVAAADPTNPAVIYLGSSGGGIWTTSNATANVPQSAPPSVWPIWQPMTDAIPDPNATPTNLASLQIGPSAHSLAVHPKNNNLVQAVTYNSGAGVLLSAQAGAAGTWSLMGGSQFDGQQMTAIAVHPQQQGVAYAATGSGLYQTTNGAQTWTQVSGLPTSGVYDVIFARFDPQGNTIFVSVVGAGVYSSTDGGKSWILLASLNSALSPPNTGIAWIQMDSGSTQALYVSILTANNGLQIFSSSDKGNTWVRLAPTPCGPDARGEWHQIVAVDPQNDDHIFVSNAYSLFESTSGGQGQNSWTRADTPTGCNSGFDWGTASFDASGNLLATADQGLFRYNPTAKTWQSLIGNLQLTAFYTCTLAGTTLAGAAQDQYNAMVDYSNQPNAGWQYVGVNTTTGLGAGSETGKVLFPPAGTDYVYLYSPLSDSNNDLVLRAQVMQPRGLQPSTSWTPIYSNNIYGAGKSNYGLAYTSQKAFVMDPYNPRRLLVGADQVYETTNADYASPMPTFNSIGPPVPDCAQPPSPTCNQLYVTAIAIAPSATNYTYAATSDGQIQLTIDDGTKWTPLDDGINGVVVGMSIDPNSAQHVFAAAGQQVWELPPPTSFGQQQTWVDRFGPGSLNVNTIFVDWQYAPPHIYIGTDRGVFTATNPSSASSWTLFGSGFPNATVDDLQSAPWTASPETSVLAAVTYGRGAFEILLAEPPPPPPNPPEHAQPIPTWISPLAPPWGEQQQRVPLLPPASPPKP